MTLFDNNIGPFNSIGNRGHFPQNTLFSAFFETQKKKI